MQGVRIGHFTNSEDGTGISVFLFENPSSGGYLICGAAPAAHELAPLNPENSVPHVHGLCVSGGSAYGLFAAQGVMNYLADQGIGHATTHGIVPIVPAAAIFDLNYKNFSIPTAEQAYQACQTASENNPLFGQIGAGTGATVGKIIPHAYSMTGGLGHAAIKLANGIEVAAYAVVNAIGDVREDNAHILAGACDQQGRFYDSTRYLLTGHHEADLFSGENSTIAVVLTNAYLDKADLTRLCKTAASGLARAISPVFTRFDGDIVFCISVGEEDSSELSLGTLASEAIRLAVLNAVKKSKIILPEEIKE